MHLPLCRQVLNGVGLICDCTSRSSPFVQTAGTIEGCPLLKSVKSLTYDTFLEDPYGLQENIHRNFGMPQPNGYRKALRFMKHADHFGFPILTFVDTPGAFAGKAAEEQGQVISRSHLLRASWSGLVLCPT